MGQRRAHYGGEDGRQCSRLIGGGHEVEFSEQLFQRGQCRASRIGRRVRDYKMPRIEHTETLCGFVITGLPDEYAVRLPEIRLPRHASQWWQVSKVLRIEQNARVPRRRIAAHP